MANGNGTMRKIGFWAVTFLLGASFTGYVTFTQGQIDSVKESVVLVHSSDSTKAVEHAQLPMHDGAIRQFETLERRYIRDSAATMYYRKQSQVQLDNINESIGDLTHWLKQNTNHDSVNGRP